jgi:hypothetical protein
LSGGNRHEGIANQHFLGLVVGEDLYVIGTRYHRHHRSLSSAAVGATNARRARIRQLGSRYLVGVVGPQLASTSDRNDDLLVGGVLESLEGVYIRIFLKSSTPGPHWTH